MVRRLALLCALVAVPALAVDYDLCPPRGGDQTSDVSLRCPRAPVEITPRSTRTITPTPTPSETPTPTPFFFCCPSTPRLVTE